MPSTCKSDCSVSIADVEFFSWKRLARIITSKSKPVFIAMYWPCKGGCLDALIWQLRVWAISLLLLNLSCPCKINKWFLHYLHLV